MSINQDWGMIHPGVFSQSAGPVRWVSATSRRHGALRYRCPVTECFVVLTDDDALAGLERPHARLRCPSCREMHLLTQVRQAKNHA